MRNRLTRRHADLTALLRAADAPASGQELAGLPRVLGAFRLATATAMTGPATETRGTRIGAWITSKVAKVTIAVAGIVFAGGVSYAAAGGNLDWLLPPRIESPAVTPSGPLRPLPAGPSSEQVQHQPPPTSDKNDPRTSSAATTGVPSATEVSTTAPAPSVTHGPTPPTATTGAVTATSDRSLPASSNDASRRVGPITDAGTSATSEETSSPGAIPTTAGQGPGPSALRGQCTAWRAHQKNGSAPGNSSQTPAAAALIAAAGGEDKIGAFCDGLLGPAATSTASDPSTTTATDVTTSAPGNSGGKGNNGNSGSNNGNGNNGNGNGNGNSGNGNESGNNGNGNGGNNGKGNGNG